MTQSNAVVVGVDGSPESRAALDFAIAECGRRQAPLRVVAAYIYPEYTGLGWPYPVLVSPEQIGQAARKVAEDMIAEALQGTDPHPEVQLVVKGGPASEVLVQESTGAALLVLGHRGRGGFSSMLLGSVGLRCVLHAHCPVTVIRPTTSDVADAAPTAATATATS